MGVAARLDTANLEALREREAALDAAIAAREEYSIRVLAESGSGSGAADNEMASLGFALAPSFWQSSPPDVPPPSAEYMQSVGAASVDGLSRSQTRSHDDFISRVNEVSVPGVQWQEDTKCYYGLTKSVCIGAWCVFLTLPLIYFTLVRRGHPLLLCRPGPSRPSCTADPGHLNLAIALVLPSCLPCD